FTRCASHVLPARFIAASPELRIKWDIPARGDACFAGVGDLIKVLWHDGDGLCLFAKRLERGRFVWPQATSGTVSLTRAQLSMLLEGIDWRHPGAHPSDPSCRCNA